MAKSFNADPLHMNVALTSYLLTLAMFIPASGRLADRFGSRTVFRAAIAHVHFGLDRLRAGANAWRSWSRRACCKAPAAR